MMEAVEPLMRAACDIVFGCDTELFIPDIEAPEALIPGHDNDQDIRKGKSDE